MRIVVQRVKRAKVVISGNTYSEIGTGILVLFGVEKGDTKEKADYLAKKICNLRIFSDNEGKMNLSVKDISGEVLVVSQFTLASHIKKGNRPSFSNAAPEAEAVPLYEYFCSLVKTELGEVKTGVFGANMQVELVNDGPVTFILER
jgi:D-tyrosyl-tRNA(Tyr) deacylase